jgi:hypothetical protein
MRRAAAAIRDGAKRDAETQREEMIADLQRLIEALDRRVPRLERLSEAKIAQDAAELRQKAVGLIAKLTREAGRPTARAAAASDARDIARMDSDSG